MAYPKHHLFIADRQKLAHFGFVISHPARLQMLQLLSRHAILTKTDFSDKSPLSRSAISSHLRYLERAQLIELGQDNRGVTGYRLIKENYWLYLQYLQEWLELVPAHAAA